MSMSGEIMGGVSSFLHYLILLFKWGGLFCLGVLLIFGVTILGRKTSEILREYQFKKKFKEDLQKLKDGK